jgi:hypothetical protein
MSRVIPFVNTIGHQSGPALAQPFGFRPQNTPKGAAGARAITTSQAHVAKLRSGAVYGNSAKGVM